MPSHRVDQLNSLIQQTVSTILLTKIDREFFRLITVTKVSTAPDLSQAKIFVSVPDGKFEKFKSWLKANIFNIQKEFNQSASLRKFPRLMFVEDETGAYVDRIDALLRKARGE